MIILILMQPLSMNWITHLQFCLTDYCGSLGISQGNDKLWKKFSPDPNPNPQNQYDSIRRKYFTMFVNRIILQIELQVRADWGKWKVLNGKISSDHDLYWYLD